MTTKPATLGELRKLSGYEPGTARRTVKDELRANILQKLEAGEPLFPGIHGYEETVLPQIANALLARHNFILLGLRGQAKSRILRGLIDFLDRKFRTSQAAKFMMTRSRPCAAPAAIWSPSKATPRPIAWLPRDATFRRKAGYPGRYDR